MENYRAKWLYDIVNKQKGYFIETTTISRLLKEAYEELEIHASVLSRDGHGWSKSTLRLLEDVNNEDLNKLIEFIKRIPRRVVNKEDKTKIDYMSGINKEGEIIPLGESDIDFKSIIMNDEKESRDGYIIFKAFCQIVLIDKNKQKIDI